MGATAVRCGPKLAVFGGRKTRVCIALSRWSQSDQYRHLDHIIHPVYSKLWFGSSKGSELRLCVGEICYMNPKWPLAFVNGTHRTRVLAKFLRWVPLAAHADVYRRRLFEGCIVREIAQDEYVTLPNLPVCEPQVLLRR